jgi:uncharacterized short protein YbdD (DUF466 family)
MPDSQLVRPFRYAWDYLKEISGENAYDRYLEVAMSRGEFYRWRQDDKYNNPGSRCP